MKPVTKNSRPGRGAEANAAAPGAEDAARPGNRLLWLAAGAFAVMIAAWAAFFFIAHRHPVETVPVVTDGGRR